MKEKKKYSKIGNIGWALRKMWRLDWHFVVFVFALVPVAVVTPLVNSYFSKALIDRIGMGGNFGQLAGLVAVFMGMITVLALADKFLHGKCDARIYIPTLIYQAEMQEIDSYQTDYENTERQEYRKIHNYAWMDISQGQSAMEFIWMDLSQGLTYLLGGITYASLLIILNPMILIAVMVITVLSYFTSRWQSIYFEKNKQNWEKEVRKKEYLANLSQDFARAKDVKLYGLAPWLEKMMRDYQTYILMWKKKCNLRGFWASSLAGVMTLLQNGLTYVVLIGLLIEQQITVGEFVFYFGIVTSITGFLQGIIVSAAKINARADKITYYRDLYAYPNKLNHGQGEPLPKAPVEIQLNDVWYRYDGAEEYTLKGINLTIRAGESLALVGLNGAGKTTLVKLICGLYVPTQGEILVGGKRINEYNIEEYYSIISAVFQEIKPIAFTMHEFVASSDLERATAREDSIHAMKMAGIYDKIEKLPLGVDTHLMKGVYDDSVDLSGGEMQKLVLARAIYKNGLILVLDEPTAALDPIAENQLYLQYRDLTKGKTSIYISHRFASTRFCDRIVLLEDGQIQEEGTHDQLMELNGKYAYMFGVQSQYYKEETRDA